MISLSNPDPCDGCTKDCEQSNCKIAKADYELLKWQEAEEDQ